MEPISIKSKIEKCCDCPYGLQDVIHNIIDDNIYIFFGFCSGDNRWRVYNSIKNKLNDSKYIRGFSNKILKYDIKKNTWHHATSYNMSNNEGVQFGKSIKIKDNIYVWGGYSYQPINEEAIKKLKYLPSKSNITTVSSGFVFDKNHNINSLPDLPYPLCGFGMTYNNNNIYIFGGALFTLQSFTTNTIVNNEKIGKGFFYYNIKNDIIEPTPIFINNFPGLPRMGHIFFEYNNFLYVMGGNYQTSEINNIKRYTEFNYCNVIDNWKYDIKKNKWMRLIDTPYLLTSQGFCFYKKKYIVLMGGSKLKYTAVYNENENDKIQVVDTDVYFKNNNIYNFNMKYNNVSSIESLDPVSKESMYRGYYSNLIILYDIENDKYLLPNVKLPITINYPKLVNYNDSIFVFSGESNVSLYNDIWYGCHTSLVLKITLDIEDN